MITSDIATQGAKLPHGGVYFVTLCAEPPKVFAENKMDAATKVDWLKDELHDGAAHCTVADVSNAKFRFYVERVLKTAMQYAFATKGEGRLVPIIDVFYRDSIWMYTLGAVFADASSATKISAIIKKKHPKLDRKNAFDIPDFNM